MKLMVSHKEHHVLTKSTKILIHSLWSWCEALCAWCEIKRGNYV